MTKIVLQPASMAHDALLAALHGAGFARPWRDQDFHHLLATPGTSATIACVTPPETDDPPTPVGFVLYRRAADQAEILTLVVLPTWRQQGVARALVDHLLGQSRQSGLAEVFLEVAEDNRPAQRLYAQLGFVQAGRRRGYYTTETGAAVDALVLRRSLEIVPP